MAKALESLFSDLTPLQQAALERIQEYKEELKQSGLYVRSAIELEFFAQTPEGVPLPERINLNGLNHVLKDMLPAPDYMQKVGFEAIGKAGLLGRSRPQVASQYEINIAEPVEKPSATFMPEIVAAITEQLKKKTLREALENSSSLAWVGGQQPKLVPNLSPTPYLHTQLSDRFDCYDELTSALHINTSLYDKDGNNMFVDSPALLYQAADSLLALQKEAALTMLPGENSLHRIHANNSTPYGIGLTIDDNIDDKAKNNKGTRFISVRVIKEPFPHLSTPEANEHTRLENRLPGMDADPFVSTAVTMAALVEAVRMQKKHVLDEKALRDKVTSTQHSLPRQSTPGAHRMLVDQYEHAQHARELLGDKLYNAILHEYAPEAAVAR